ncbi:MAG: hypothetical protein Q8Q01_05520 [archaeon]|nr:hypothetical protein [archaeon]
MAARQLMTSPVHGGRLAAKAGKRATKICTYLDQHEDSLGVGRELVQLADLREAHPSARVDALIGVAYTARHAGQEERAHTTLQKATELGLEFIDRITILDCANLAVEIANYLRYLGHFAWAQECLGPFAGGSMDYHPKQAAISHYRGSAPCEFLELLLPIEAGAPPLGNEEALLRAIREAEDAFRPSLSQGWFFESFRHKHLSFLNAWDAIGSEEPWPALQRAATHLAEAERGFRIMNVLRGLSLCKLMRAYLGYVSILCTSGPPSERDVTYTEHWFERCCSHPRLRTRALLGLARTYRATGRNAEANACLVDISATEGDPFRPAIVDFVTRALGHERPGLTAASGGFLDYEPVPPTVSWGALDEVSNRKSFIDTLRAGLERAQSERSTPREMTTLPTDTSNLPALKGELGESVRRHEPSAASSLTDFEVKQLAGATHYAEWFATWEMLRAPEPAPKPPDRLLLTMGDPRPYKCVVAALAEGIEAWLEHRPSRSDVATRFPYLTKAVVLEYVSGIAVDDEDRRLLEDELAAVLAGEPSDSSSSGTLTLRAAAPKLLAPLHQYLCYYHGLDRLLD